MDNNKKELFSPELLEALKNSYNEILEFTPDNNTLSVIYSDGKFIKPDQLFSQDNVDDIYPEDAERLKEVIESPKFKNPAVKTGTKYTSELRRKCADGTYRWSYISVIVTETADGGSVCCIFSRDIDDMKRSELKNVAETIHADAAFKKDCIFVCEVNADTGLFSIQKDCFANKIKKPAATFNEFNRFIADNFIPEEEKDEYLHKTSIDYISEKFDSGENYNYVYRLYDENHELRWNSSAAVPFTDEETGSRMFVLYIRDITEKKEADQMEANLRLMQQEMEYRKITDYHEARYKAIIEQTDIVSFEYSGADNTLYISPNMKKKIKTTVSIEPGSKADIVYQMIHDGTVFTEDAEDFSEFITDVKAGRVNSEFTCRLRCTDDEYRWYRICASAVTEGDGNSHVIGTVQNVDDQLKALEELRLRADKDMLTGLNNETKMFDDIDNALHADDGKQYAFVLFDIDKFKLINEIYGGKTADKLLRSIGKMLISEFADAVSIGRLQGDNFGILTEYKDNDDLIAIVNKITETLGSYKDVRYTVSCGIYKIAKQNANPRSVFDYAKLAKSTIKGNMMASYAFYDEKFKSRMLYEKEIEDEMETALAERQFEMWLQPKYNIKTAKIIGAEALVRWNHPEKGLIPPNDFIPLFERNGFIVKLDEFMWQEACITIRDWLDRGCEAVPISVNVSRLHISNPDLINILNSMTEKYHIPKNLLELEITESVFYDNQRELFDVLINLKKEGYILEMDDFGSGYSSLNMLKNSPFDVLKIDRGFLNETMVTDRGKKIILHTIAMSNDIGMGIIAEGVETRNQADYLLDCGCSVAQGYYYSKPIRRQDFNLKAFPEKYA